MTSSDGRLVRTATLGAAAAFALLTLAACGGGGGGPKPSGGSGGDPKDMTNIRPSPHGITTIDGNLLAIDAVSPSRKVENGALVPREPRTPGVTWERETEYPIIDNLLPGGSRQLDDEPWDSWYFYGRWSNANYELSFGGHQYEPSTTKRIASFGVTLENDAIDPWAYGVEPLTNFADNPQIQAQGTVEYDGILVGFTSSTKQPMGSGVGIELSLGADITGTFELYNLATIEKDGSLKEFLGGTLRHDIAVTGNTFTTTGGDPGTVTGIFAGERHEAAAGTFQHSAFTGAFSAEHDVGVSVVPGPAPASTQPPPSN